MIKVVILLGLMMIDACEVGPGFEHLKIRYKNKCNKSDKKANMIGQKY